MCLWSAGGGCLCIFCNFLKLSIRPLHTVTDSPGQRGLNFSLLCLSSDSYNRVKHHEGETFLLSDALTVSMTALTSSPFLVCGHLASFILTHVFKSTLGLKANTLFQVYPSVKGILCRIFLKKKNHSHKNNPSLSSLMTPSKCVVVSRVCRNPDLCLYFVIFSLCGCV